MKRSILLAGVLLAFGSLAAQASDKQAARPALKAATTAAMRMADSTSPGLAAELVGRWEKSLREVRGWDDGAIGHFQRELAGMPSDTLKAALETRNWDTLQTILMHHQGAASAARLEQATADWRSGAALDETNVEEATLKRTLSKALGDADKDLIFIPVQPCTTWDTRFATIPAHAGIITAASNKPGFVYHSSAGPFDWSPYGGNPSCDSTAVLATYGVIPYAVAYTLYTADATAQGWVTAYRDTDPDPSSATISLYYTPGPTRSTTVVTRVGRAIAAPYDIRVASQFGNVHVAASVIGYFIQSAATALDCTDVTLDQVTAAGVRAIQQPSCAAGYTLTGGGVHTCGSGSCLNDSQTMNASGPIGNSWFGSITNNSGVSKTFTFYARCCRVPGR